jgi:hypothetical protein
VYTQKSHCPLFHATTYTSLISFKNKTIESYRNINLLLVLGESQCLQGFEIVCITPHSEYYFINRLMHYIKLLKTCHWLHTTCNRLSPMYKGTHRLYVNSDLYVKYMIRHMIAVYFSFFLGGGGRVHWNRLTWLIHWNRIMCLP